MNRIFRSICAGLLSAAMLLSLTGCRNSAAESRAEETASEAVSEEAGPERTESVTISAEVIQKTGADIAATARKLGLENVISNDDGSCTIYMTEEEQERVRTTFKASLDAQLAVLPEEFQWPFLDGVTISEDCRRVTLETTAKRYNAVRDNTVAQIFYLPCLLYTAICGEDTESFVLHFTVVDTTTGAALCEFDYPEQEAAAEPEVTDTDSGEITE